MMIIAQKERTQRATVVSVKARIMVAVVTGEEPRVVTQSCKVPNGTSAKLVEGRFRTYWKVNMAFKEGKESIRKHQHLRQYSNQGLARPGQKEELAG